MSIMARDLRGVLQIGFVTADNVTRRGCCNSVVLVVLVHVLVLVLLRVDSLGILHSGFVASIRAGRRNNLDRNLLLSVLAKGRRNDLIRNLLLNFDGLEGGSCNGNLVAELIHMQPLLLSLSVPASNFQKSATDYNEKQRTLTPATRPCP